LVGGAVRVLLAKMAGWGSRLRRNRFRKDSYAQCGEDRILEHLFSWLKIEGPSYLDIGAHHPTYLSNTYHFYCKGGRGVCVEPDPALFGEIARRRPKDVCLNVGVGTAGLKSAPFYVMTAPTLNTFSEEEARRYQSYGTYRIEKVLEIPLVTVNDIIAAHFPAGPDLVSLDVEGLDLEILHSFDFAACRPVVFCIETISYTEDNTETKCSEIIEFMKGKDYIVYADTYINTIFVDQARWKHRS